MRKIEIHVSHLFLPLSVLVLLIIINLIKGADYFSITVVNGALYGNIPNILFGASELVILTIGMTLVTAASQGQDISVGVASTITSAVFVMVVLKAGGDVTIFTIAGAFLLSCAAGLLVGAFNGALVSVFNVQPMVATLILFTGGRSIAFMIDGKLSPILANDLSNQIELSYRNPDSDAHNPDRGLYCCHRRVLKTTNLRLYVESVGINPSAARLNGINPKKIIFLTFLIMESVLPLQDSLL